MNKSVRPTDQDSVLMSTGGTVTQLAALFGKSVADVSKLIRGKIEPSGFRKGFPLYRVRDAAPYLSQLPDDVVYRVLHMNSDDLPSELAKNFWESKNKKLDFMERIGDLWRSDVTQEVLADCYKSIRLSLLLFSDAVERQIGLTEPQRELIIKLVDTALNDAADRMVHELRTEKAKGDRDARPDYQKRPESDDLDI